TKILTRHIDGWEKAGSKDPALLAKPCPKASPIVTNAWRRQQEQFFVKGNSALKSGGGIVFCLGSLIFDRLMLSTKQANLKNLKNKDWTLALIGFSENKESSHISTSLNIGIDQEKIFFTNYNDFALALIDQGVPSLETFSGEFITLAGERVILSD
ncbi:MAG: hypothetical protein HC799_18950, partial [Limnothrix sp. RL_2_0]|nr:hypothetical protein [Limnothrix sp. RL_2_0]